MDRPAGICDEAMSLRASGHVARWHTLQHVNRQTDAEHSAQALSLLLLLHPDPSVNLIKSLLWHDSAERVCGDMPAPIKRENPELSAHYEAAEMSFFEIHPTVIDAMTKLTEDERLWLKAVDVLELLLYCHDEIAMGNSHFEIIEKRARQYLASAVTPIEVTQFVNRFQHRSFA